MAALSQLVAVYLKLTTGGSWPKAPILTVCYQGSLIFRR